MLGYNRTIKRTNINVLINIGPGAGGGGGGKEGVKKATFPMMIQRPSTMIVASSGVRAPSAILWVFIREVYLQVNNSKYKHTRDKILHHLQKYRPMSTIDVFDISPVSIQCCFLSFF